MKDPRLIPDGPVKYALLITSGLSLLAILVVAVIIHFEDGKIKIPASSSYKVFWIRNEFVAHVTTVLPSVDQTSQVVIVTRDDPAYSGVSYTARFTSPSQVLEIGDVVFVSESQGTNVHARKNSSQHSFDVKKKIE